MVQQLSSFQSAIESRPHTGNEEVASYQRKHGGGTGGNLSSVVVVELHQQLLLLLTQAAPGSRNQYQCPQEEPNPQTSSCWPPCPPPGAPILASPLA